MSTSIPSLALAGACALVTPASLCAQFFPKITPLPKTLDMLVVDSSADGVWRMMDLNQDGDYLDAGEIVPYYDDNSPRTSLTNPSCIATGPLGQTYIADSSEDIVLRLRDTDGDGAALSPGENNVFFSSNNASNVVMASAQSITADLIGNVFIATANTSSSGNDAIIKLFDSNGDGDADDPGEAIEYVQVPGGGTSTGASIPTEVRIGPDHAIYYCENGVTGSPAKGVYRAFDANGNGHCNDPGEVTLYWSPIGNSSPFFWGMEITADGTFYVTDHSNNETTYVGRDTNGDGRISSAETTIFYQTNGSTWWDVVVRDDGLVILCEDQSPDRLTALRDLNGDGDALDQGESWQIYEDSLAVSADIRPRGATFMPGTHLEVQPATVNLGNSFTLRAQTPNPQDPIGFVIAQSLATNPLSIAPHGEFLLDPSSAVSIFVGSSDSSGAASIQQTVPNSSALIGTFAFQAFGGDPSRLHTSNATVLTVQ